jgi:hypothetical protein
VPLRGTDRLIRYRLTKVSTQALPERYPVCPSPLRPSSTPEAGSSGSAYAQRYGMAGSRVVPTTRTGDAPTARITGCGCHAHFLPCVAS